MIVGYPNDGTWARDPHSVHAMRFGPLVLLGGLLDGPVYRSIYANLRGIRLVQPDEYARFNGGFIVYHDDVGDYSTNEPIMDGTASLVYLLAALSVCRPWYKAQTLRACIARREAMTRVTGKLGRQPFRPGRIEETRVVGDERLDPAEAVGQDKRRRKLNRIS